MNGSDFDVVRMFFERVSRGEIDASLELVAGDSVLEVPPSMSAEPDVYLGHEGARRYMAGFDGLVEGVRFDALDMLEETGHVIVLMRTSGRGATSGIDIALEAAVVCRVEDGKITRLKPFPDLEAARLSLRPSP